MFWIHGGGGTEGAGSYSIFNGARLAEERDVVVVTFNYRLGPFGFLALPELAQENENNSTGNYGLLAPLMLVCTVAMIVYPRNSIYQKQVKSRIDSPVHLGEFIVDVLEGIRVEDLQEHGRKPTLIAEGLPLPEILKLIANAEGAYYPVVDDELRMISIFSVNDIRRILTEDLPPSLVLAGDIAVTRVITTTPDESLTEVMRKLSSRGLEEIPVVTEDDPQHVLYMLTRRAVLARYATELEKKKEHYSSD